MIVGLSGFACLVGFLTVLLNPSNGVLMFILFGMYGFGAYPLYAIAVAHANDFAKDGEFGRVAGGMLLILGIGLAIGPIIAAWVMNTIAPVGLFIVTATFHGALAVTAFLRMKVRPVRDARGRVRFRAMNAEKGVSPGTVALDPRADENQENLPRTPARAATPAAPATHVTEVLVPDPMQPMIVIEEERKPDTPPDMAAEPEAPAPAAPETSAVKPKKKPAKE